MDNNAKVPNQQAIAKKYIEEHDLERIVSEMLNSLVHEKAKQPFVYMIKYLAGLLTEEERTQNNLVIPEPYPKGRPIVKFPNLEKTPENSLLKKHLTKPIWSNLKYNKTKYGGNINNTTKLAENLPEDKIGCVLTDGDCITTFGGLLDPLISEAHNIKQGAECPQNSHPQAGPNTFPFWDRIFRSMVYFRISFSRNLSEFPYTPIISNEKRIQVEALVNKEIKGLISENIIKNVKYYTMKDNENEAKQILKSLDYDEEWMSAADLKNNWPENRGIFSTEEGDLVILVNFIDHIQIILTNKVNYDLPKLYNSAIVILKSLERSMTFDYSKQYGYLTTNVGMIGYGMELSSGIQLVILPKKPNFYLNEMIANMEFESWSISMENDVYALKTKALSKLSYSSELDFIENYYSKISGLIHIDRECTTPSTCLSFDKMKIDGNFSDIYIKDAYEEVYDEYKYKISSSGSNLNSIVNYYVQDPMNPFGVLFHETNEYKTFHKFIQKYIKSSQSFDIDLTDHIHKPEENKTMTNINQEDSDRVVSTSICVIRNIADMPFPTSNFNDNKRVEEMIIKTLDAMNTKTHVGTYYSMAKATSKDKAQRIIQENQLMIFHRDNFALFNMETDFPAGRGVIQFDKENLFAVVNDVDHIKFFLNINTPVDKLSTHFVNVLKLTNEFSKHIKFVYDMKLGFLTTSPRFVGTGLLIKTQLKLYKIHKKKIEEIVQGKEFAWKIVKEGTGEYVIELVNKFTIGRSETELLTNLLITMNELIEADKKV